MLERDGADEAAVEVMQSMHTRLYALVVGSHKAYIPMHIPS